EVRGAGALLRGAGVYLYVPASVLIIPRARQDIGTDDFLAESQTGTTGRRAGDRHTGRPRVFSIHASTPNVWGIDTCIAGYVRRAPNRRPAVRARAATRALRRVLSCARRCQPRLGLRRRERADPAACAVVSALQVRTSRELVVMGWGA